MHDSRAPGSPRRLARVTKGPLRPAPCRAAALVFAAISLCAPIASAEETLLRGPYPFRKDNELALRGGFAAGVAASPPVASQARADYGYRMHRDFWLDIELGFVSGSCNGANLGRNCSGRTGDLASVMGGVKWKLAMDVPVVPYVKVVGGFFYLFPDESPRAFGAGLRPAVGATYFLFEWLGVGLEVGATVARFAGRDPDLDEAAGLGAIDIGLGVELAF